MRLGSYFVGDRASYGVIVDGGVVDLGRRVGSRYADLRSLLAANATGEAREIGQRNTPDIAVSDVSWLPTIPNPAKSFSPASTTNRTSLSRAS